MVQPHYWNQEQPDDTYIVSSATSAPPESNVLDIPGLQDEVIVQLHEHYSLVILAK